MEANLSPEFSHIVDIKTETVVLSLSLVLVGNRASTLSSVFGPVREYHLCFC